MGKYQSFPCNSDVDFIPVYTKKTLDEKIDNYSVKYLTELSDMHKSIRETFNKCFTTSLAKSHDYSKGENTFRNFESGLKIGVSVQKSIMIRIQDKIARLENLLESDKAQVEEKLEDTIEDCINYLAILKAQIEREAKQ